MYIHIALHTFVPARRLISSSVVIFFQCTRRHWWFQLINCYYETTFQYSPFYDSVFLFLFCSIIPRPNALSSLSIADASSRRLHTRFRRWTLFAHLPLCLFRFPPDKQVFGGRLHSRLCETGAILNCASPALTYLLPSMLVSYAIARSSVWFFGQTTITAFFSFPRTINSGTTSATRVASYLCVVRRCSRTS